LASGRFELLTPKVTIQQIMQLRPLPFAGGPVFTLIFWIAFVIWKAAIRNSQNSSG